MEKSLISTNWEECCLCQEVKNEKLTKPRDVTRRGESGYAMLTRNIPKLHEQNLLPFPKNIKRLDDGSGIKNTLHSLTPADVSIRRLQVSVLSIITPLFTDRFC